jgi:hypothetical protein
MSHDWTWELLDPHGKKLDADLAPSVFPTQSDAESWLGEEWRSLLEGGVEAVNLKQGDTLVYGPMSLSSTE